MFKMLIEILKEEKKIKDKIGVLFYIAYYSLGFICSFFLIFSGKIILSSFGIIVLMFYTFIEGYLWEDF